MLHLNTPTRVTIFDGNGNPTKRWTLQIPQKEGRTLTYTPEGGVEEGSLPNRSRINRMRGFRRDLAIKWSSGLRSTLEWWEAGAWQPNFPALLRQNLVANSDHAELWGSTSAGTGVAPSITAGYGVAPDGNQTAARVVLNKGAGGTNTDQSRIYAIPTGPVYYGDTDCWSVWLKTVSGGVSNVAIEVLSGGGVSVVAVNGNWQKFYTTTTETFSSPTPTLGYVSLRGTYGTDNTADILVWRGQWERGRTTPTRGIQTTGMASARITDPEDNTANALMDILDANEVYPVLIEPFVGDPWPSFYANVFVDGLNLKDRKGLVHKDLDLKVKAVDLTASVYLDPTGVFEPDVFQPLTFI